MTKNFNASKTRSGRPGWAITFRHPLRADSRGKAGRKVRRGLGTDDEQIADALVAEMNVILKDPAWWNAGKRAEAEKRFSRRIVDAFFDEIQAGAADPEDLRERFIELPDASAGFSRVLLVGTTGAGKTTVLRQIIGSDPKTERFPSTAPAKTTIADIEVVVDDCDFSAIVTFFSEFQVQASIEECILDAAMASFFRNPRSKIVERFLNHRDQKFRLSYLLGTLPDAAGENDDFAFDIDDDDDADPDQNGVSETERERNAAVLTNIIDRIVSISGVITQRNRDNLLYTHEHTTIEDQEALQELIEEAFETDLHQQEEFHDLVQDVLDLIKERFKGIEGELQLTRSEWPQSCTFRTAHRAECIEFLKKFSDNHWSHFGDLLTPVVNGLRVRGPFFSEVNKDSRLVLIDGQGIGHTPDLSSSVTTHITRKFEDVDVILLVDNAQQPMQAAPLAILRAVGYSGYTDKVSIAFTHFDLIKGQNLPTVSEKRAHVMASVLSAVANLRDGLGLRVSKSLERGLDGKCFMLGGTNRSIKSLPPKAASFAVSELKRLVLACEQARHAKSAIDASIVYDPVGISFAVQDAASKFSKSWKSRLGLISYASTRREHWTRVKALNKRIATELSVEYDTLRPMADMHAFLMEAISRYLDTPLQEDLIDDEERTTMRIRQLVAAQLFKVVRKRLIRDELNNWREAYSVSGNGSTKLRALEIADIVDRAAPIPSALMSDEARLFHDQIAQIIASAVETVGGSMSVKAYNMMRPI